MEAKQVIVMRKDLKMRKGKMISQGAHASLGVILKQMVHENDQKGHFFKYLSVSFSDPLYAWLTGIFTKITVSVDSEEELMKIYNLADSKGLPCILIEDKGLTEFKGVVTKTCIAIGPAWNEDIDKITGHLKLL